MERIINRANKEEEFIKKLKSCNIIDNKYYIECIDGAVHTNYLPEDFFDFINNFHITYFDDIERLTTDSFYFKDGCKLKKFLLTIMREKVVDCIAIYFDAIN